MERIHAVTFAPFLFIAGCEMVQTERREAEWRKVIAAIRRKYDRPVSYNTDKYQEHNVKWWDAWHGDGRNPVKRGDYEVYGKAAADIIYRKFSQVSE